jgi:predicted GIY-YIG superfamily endonuclease
MTTGYGDMTVEELEDRLADYEQWGWKTHAEEAEARLKQIERTDKEGSSTEELSYEERLSQANMTGSEDLRCDSITLHE